jgi:hypothetical protein
MLRVQYDRTLYGRDLARTSALPESSEGLCYRLTRERSHVRETTITRLVSRNQLPVRAASTLSFVKSQTVFHEQTSHDCLAGARIVSEEEPKVDGEGGPHRQL